MQTVEDTVATEEALEIRIVYGVFRQKTQKSVSGNYMASGMKDLVVKLLMLQA